ncbi:MAG: UvrD-helicase domain-containing protein [Muribaculaceae bacterium]|nr:UvrD-helicase domain-containing protein [Muribaculaceae bacterium]
MNDIFKDLNNKQCEAVVATEGKVRVVAGAGSGKTRVLAHRYAYLVNELGIDPGNILCMTFTNKAAQEMKIRISKLVHRGHVNDFVCTIHGFCVKFLRREIHRLGYPKSFIIIDDEDSKLLAKQVMEEFHLDAKDTTVKAFLSRVGGYKIFNPYIEEIIVPTSNISFEGLSDSVIPVIRYIQLQQKNYLLDFQDLIYFTLYIMNHHEDALVYWQQKMNYIMVDEAQDCSGADWTIVNNLAGGYDNLFIVGDPDQCIYEWRGAKPDGFLSFPAETDVILNQNYRSTPNILDVANSIISHNENRIPKDLFTITPSSKIVLHYHGKTETDEANWIATQIENISKNGSEYNDFAILYRASYLSRTIEQALLKKQIKYVVWGGIRFFERREIKDMLAYFRLIAYKQDDLSFRRIINTPSRKFGKVSMARLQELASAENTSLYDALLKHHKDDAFNKSSILSFIQLIDELTEKSKYMLVSDLFDHVFKGSGLEDMYRTEGDDERLENIAELKHSIKEYEMINAEEDDVSLETYLQDVALYTNADYKNDGTAVKLMTIHQAKGLEFPYVFVCGLTEGIFPSHRTIRERKKNGEEEERRLMYVAVTRAERGLFLTESEGYNSATRSDKFPSRFLKEVKDGLIEVKGDLTKEQMAVLFEGTKQVIEELDSESIPLNFNVGDKVIHRAFGIGEIIEKSSDSSYKVRFVKGDRFIQSTYLRIYDANNTTDAPPLSQHDARKARAVASNNSELGFDILSLDQIREGSVVEHKRFGRGTIKRIKKLSQGASLEIEFDNHESRMILLKFAKLKLMNY